MTALDKNNFNICVVGLGYVGLPLAARFALKGFNVIGFDINEDRIQQLVNRVDVNNDISDAELEILVQNTKLTSLVDEINESNIFIVTVPTPINEDKTPDLSPLKTSSELIGSVMKKGSIVIYESTVYPGVTDEVCSPILEKRSGLIFNKEFSTGYSPERIVPGDKDNTVEKIIKVVSASNKNALEIISFIYSIIIDAGVHEAPSIKVAEAAKVTENIQRDVNIALINEMHQLYTSIGINTYDVINAASTKWNFMKLTPGLVGGHCISIDPYYLLHKSKMSGYIPDLMMTARTVNDEMGAWALENFVKFTKNNSINLEQTTVTVAGYTFKENCSDIRNTKVHDLITLMINSGLNVNLWDPHINEEVKTKLTKIGVFVYEKKPLDADLIFLCVYHDEILEFLDVYEGFVFDYRNPLC
jgi:UDP-N-acetyl-D-galactosamine dehydrogenase